MSKLFNIFTLALVLASCGKEDEQVPQTSNNFQDGTLSIRIENKVGQEALVLSDLRYTNAAGNLYSVNMLKYYVSNVSLHKKSGGYKNISVYKLIDAALPASCIFDAGTTEAGEYDSLVMYVGIDPQRNHTGVQDGDLDVSKGMFWTWNTGYIFYKHEGQYRNSSGQTRPMIFHLGSDKAYTRVSMPVNLLMNGNKTMSIEFDLNSAYTTPQNIDFNTDNNRQSTSSADAVWISNMKSNLGDAFSFIKAE